MAYSVYKLTNIVNGKEYIGVSRDSNKRLYEHRYSPNPIGKAIRKYGKDAFKLSILLISDQNYCYEIESACIARYQTRIPNGYNVAPGGNRGADCTGKKHTQQTKEKIAAAHRGCKRQFTEEWKAKMRLNIKRASAARTKDSFKKMTATKKKNGKKLPPISEETRKKLSKIHKGQIPWNKGKKLSEEHRQKLVISSPKKRKPHSEETKRKIGEKSKGRYFSPETRKKMSESRKLLLLKEK